MMMELEMIISTIGVDIAMDGEDDTYDLPGFGLKGEYFGFALGSGCNISEDDVL